MDCSPPGTSVHGFPRQERCSRLLGSPCQTITPTYLPPLHHFHKQICFVSPWTWPCDSVWSHSGFLGPSLPLAFKHGHKIWFGQLENFPTTHTYPRGSANSVTARAQAGGPLSSSFTWWPAGSAPCGMLDWGSQLFPGCWPQGPPQLLPLGALSRTAYGTATWSPRSSGIESVYRRQPLLHILFVRD